MTLKAAIKRLSAGNLKTVMERLSAATLKPALKRLFAGNLRAALKKLSAGNLRNETRKLSAGNLWAALKGLSAGDLRATIKKLSTRKVMSLVNAALVAAVMLFFLLLARDTVSLLFSGASEDGVPDESRKERPVREARKALMDYAPVLSKNVFGFPAAELTPISSQQESVVEEVVESVDVKLVGAVAWPGGFGYAIVEGGPEGQEVYRTGDTIEGAGRLSRVESHGIVIESGGREVRVSLEDVAEPAPSRKPRGRRRAARRTSPPAGNALSGPSAEANGFARQTAANEFVVNKKAIDESLGNPKNVLTDARLLPRMVEGEQEGFTMSEVKQGGLYDSIGLKDGDVLLSVNDFKLSNPETALQAFTALKGMDRIKLDIMRGGKKMTLTYTIR